MSLDVDKAGWKASTDGTVKHPRRAASAPDDLLWYNDALINQVPVRSFFDSDGDGVGDYPGLTKKLDYLHDQTEWAGVSLRGILGFLKEGA